MYIATNSRRLYKYTKTMVLRHDIANRCCPGAELPGADPDPCERDLLHRTTSYILNYAG